MKRLNDEYKLFQAQLNKFESVFNKYGFTFLTTDYSFFEPISMEAMRHRFLNRDNDLEVEVSFVISDVIKNRVQVNFAMENPQRQRFSLVDFQEDNPSVSNIKTDLFVDQNYADDLNKFFSALEKAFETYLHKQISGIAFEDHSAKLMEAYYNSGAVYDMQKQAVDEAIQKREAELAKGTLWNRIKRIFKS